MEQDGDDIPEPTPVKDIVLDDGEVVAMIEVFMPSIRLNQKNKGSRKLPYDIKPL